MKHDLTTGTWQDDTGCPISIILAATSDVVLYQNAKICVTRFETKFGAPPWTQHIWYQ
jgi:hypothetical protein